MFLCELALATIYTPRQLGVVFLWDSAVSPWRCQLYSESNQSMEKYVMVAAVWSTWLHFFGLDIFFLKRILDWIWCCAICSVVAVQSAYRFGHLDSNQLISVWSFFCTHVEISIPNSHRCSWSKVKTHAVLDHSIIKPRASCRHLWAYGIYIAPIFFGLSILT